VATARNTAWTIDLHVSRGVVFHSTALVATGVYLLIVAAAAYWARAFGGNWGEILAIAFVFAALLGLAVLMLSAGMRARLSVFVSKHFFSHRYDWRREWLRFTQMLGTAAHRQELYDRVLQALANLVESLGGSLWLERDGSYLQVARRDFPRVPESEPGQGSLAAFLRRTGWVVRLDEVASRPERYEGLVVPAWLAGATQAWLVIPLMCNGLVGFVVLKRPRAAIEVNWEVLDLLKTAGRQAASFLAQLQTSEALLEAEKFGAFNRMSAFVVHDLKNLVSQLALLLKNAERHRQNPEFQRDMLATIEHVVTRMNRLMLQLRDGTAPPDHPRPVELCALLERVLKAHEARRVTIEPRPADGLRVLAHEDRIERVVGHLVQNALEATAEAGPAGRVTLRVHREGGHAVLEVADNGVGMSEEFVRERLFRPFQTTKAHGMGVGLNESFQYVSAIGGVLAVDSAPGRGSTFRVRLPLADVAGHALEQAA
jgi:putative PEP-CTERM system histidine kinase